MLLLSSPSDQLTPTLVAAPPCLTLPHLSHAAMRLLLLLLLSLSLSLSPPRCRPPATAHTLSLLPSLLRHLEPHPLSLLPSTSVALLLLLHLRCTSILLLLPPGLVRRCKPRLCQARLAPASLLSLAHSALSLVVLPPYGWSTLRVSSHNIKLTSPPLASPLRPYSFLSLLPPVSSPSPSPSSLPSSVSTLSLSLSLSLSPRSQPLLLPYSLSSSAHLALCPLSSPSLPFFFYLCCPPAARVLPLAHLLPAHALPLLLLFHATLSALTSQRIISFFFDFSNCFLNLDFF